MRNILLLPVLLLTGCVSTLHQPMTEEERIDQDCRFKGALYDTSPRAMNRLPKAIPSLKKVYTPAETPVETIPIEEQGL